MTPNPSATCTVCIKPFVRCNSMQVVCSARCAVKVPVLARKKDRQDTLRRKEAAKSRARWLAEAQSVVNGYVRLRDARQGCVSCDRPASWGGQWHASHLRSVGAASAIRFNLWNIHKACSICNNHLSGNLMEYIDRLPRRIGEEKVKWLYSQNHRAQYPVEYLKRLKTVFRKKTRRMEARNAM